MSTLLKKGLDILGENKLLALVTVLAAALRFLYFTNTPPALNWDEVSHGYNAYSILKTGADEWGQKFPIFNFRAYGDYPLPLNLYLTIPSILLLGLSEFSIRLPHALLGVLTVIATYFLAVGLTKNKVVGLLSSCLVAIEPWTVFTSRVVLQQNVSIFFLTASFAAFFNRDKNKYLLPISLTFLFLTLFSYHSTRIFSPLILLAGMIVYRHDVLRSVKGTGGKFFLFSCGVFFLLSTLIVIDPAARARSKWLFIIDQSAINRIEEKREGSKLPPLLNKLVHNKATYFSSHFASNYIGYLSPRFLFLSGGTQYQYSLPSHGLSYILNLFPFYLGALFLLKKSFKGNKDYMFLLAWLLLSPIPGSITNETFAVTRASVMLPLPQILTAIGALGIFDYLSRRSNLYKFLAPAIYFVVLFILAASYFVNYFTIYPREYSWAWQYGYREVVDFARENYDKYDKIIVTKKYGEPHEFFLFFLSWNPGKYKADPNLIRYSQSDWYWVDRFDKFYFVNDWDIPTDDGVFVLESAVEEVDCTDPKVRCLLITTPSKFPKEWKKLSEVNFLGGMGAFEIYEN